KAGSATDVLPQVKKAIAAADLKRTIARAGVQLNWHPNHPVRSVKALRLLHAVAEETERGELTEALYRAYWVENRAIDDEDVLLDIARGLKRPVRFSVPLDRSLFAAPSLTQALRDATSEVVAKGSPGVPAFWVKAPRTTWREEEALFFGQDRLHFVASMLAGRMIPQPRISAPGPVVKPKTLTFYFDFSSPWAFLGYQVLGRFRDELRNVKVDLVPIVVGALFKTVGTPVVPRDAYSPVKVAYGDKDMIDRAAWIHDINVADPETLAGLLTKNGFDAHALMIKANSEEVKGILRNNTDRAVQVGCCGVPSFQVDGSDVFWGQDHVVHVLDELHEASGVALSRL
ncbi:hypothetical protein HK405_005032, partial [Cladochytrium tenue]